MQINRLFQIVYTLLEKKTVTAKQLAEKLEVSTRTIYRDIEVLSESGVPVYTNKGTGGGISLLDNFVLSKSVLTEREQGDILAALQSYSAINNNAAEEVLGKLSGLFKRDTENWIEVDFSEWSFLYKNNFNQIKTAILDKKILRFEYFNSQGIKTSREVEPLQLWFKHRSWYLKAFCLEKQDMRVFKLSRIKNIAVSQQSSISSGRSLCSFESSYSQPVFNNVMLRMHMNKNIAFRVYDEFDEDNITQMPDESFEVTAELPEDEWLYGYIMSFGAYAEVLEPQSIRDEVKNRLTKMLGNY